jgi:hypothetical protein
MPAGGGAASFFPRFFPESAGSISVPQSPHAPAPAAEIEEAEAPPTGDDDRSAESKEGDAADGSIGSKHLLKVHSSEILMNMLFVTFHFCMIFWFVFCTHAQPLGEKIRYITFQCKT